MTNKWEYRHVKMQNQNTDKKYHNFYTEKKGEGSQKRSAAEWG